MRSWSVPAGRLFGVDIRIHFTFLFLLAFVWFTQSVAMGTTGAVRGVALVVIIFGCVVLHELGHALVARRSGVAVRSIILLPIGGVTLMEEVNQRNSDSARDIRIAIAGPLGESGDRRGFGRLYPDLFAAGPICGVIPSSMPAICLVHCSGAMSFWGPSTFCRPIPWTADVFCGRF